MQNTETSRVCRSAVSCGHKSIRLQTTRPRAADFAFKAPLAAIRCRPSAPGQSFLLVLPLHLAVKRHVRESSATGHGKRRGIRYPNSRLRLHYQHAATLRPRTRPITTDVTGPMGPQHKSGCPLYSGMEEGVRTITSGMTGPMGSEHESGCPLNSEM